MMLTLARTTIAIMLFLALMLFGTIIGARALPAVEEHLFFYATTWACSLSNTQTPRPQERLSIS
jgi:hypothetical protein